jgi:uncharacterized membrane protein YccF (DUF307 family)
MNLLGNLIWILCGGFFASLGYLIGGFLLCCTVIGIPFGVQCFKLAYLVLWPFGKQVVSRPSATGCLSPFFNIAWLLCGGLYTAFMHFVFGCLLAITIIGLPFAAQHFKLIPLALMPFGKDVVG